jgi:transcriptional regulator with XRE-family HTH domain
MLVGVNSLARETEQNLAARVARSDPGGAYDRMELGEKLRGLLRDRRLSQQDVADSMDVSQAMVSLWVRGKNVPDVFQARELAQLLGVTVDFLADNFADAPPLPEVTPAEREILNMVRDIGIARARRRLLRVEGDEAPTPRADPPAPRYATEVGRANLPFDPPRQHERPQRGQRPSGLPGEPAPLPAPPARPDDVELDQGAARQPKHRPPPKRKR